MTLAYFVLFYVRKTETNRIYSVPESALDLAFRDKFVAAFIGFKKTVNEDSTK